MLRYKARPACSPLSTQALLTVFTMVAALCLPENIEQRSMDAESWREANDLRWFLSQDAGQDVGETAIRKWVLDHWAGFSRARWLDHMLGRCYWVELKYEEFGMLTRDIGVPQPLLDELVHMLKCGFENLPMLLWARTQPLEIQFYVKRFLALVKINEHRFRCKFHDDA